ncbi:MAG: nicotinate-nucleotide diphosphorylase (carboxylating) [Gammaproteobacteria bacterium 28-57-27]|nr:MAG: nicotinate-nucleotide diphosphorylase (carboxylating) [Gammaproteobacteria bacterium 28-57-27]
MHLPAHDFIARNVAQALSEDVGSGDVSAMLIDVDTQARANVITRESMTLAGRAWFNEVFAQLDPQIQIEWAASDGDHLTSGALLCTLRGSARSILTGERSALNFMQTLSATATKVNHFVRLISGAHARILDTRKTIPGLRLAQKYAVTCGGGWNHRMGLYDAILIKENHIAAAGGITPAVVHARHLYPDLPLEVEVENLSQLEEALMAGAPRILLDNFDLNALHQAVRLTRGQAQLEASGGVNENTVRAIAETGVDFISIGALTKDIQAIDLSMRFTTA